MPGLNVSMNMAKGMFFDRPRVVSEVGSRMASLLGNFGALVRKIAMRSIRSRKKASSPGDPPSNHTGLLKRFIFYSYDRSRRSVLIGPVKLNATSGLNLGAKGHTIPQTLEYGGPTVRTDYFSKMTRTWKPLTSSKSAQRVDRWGRPTRKRNVTIAARPFMRPAFNAALPQLPSIMAKHNYTSLSINN
jgi:hypothetical protein